MEEQPISTPEAQPSQPDIDTLLQQAEQRGYLRGRNEAIQQLMSAPSVWQPLRPDPSAGDQPGDDSLPTILGNMRPDVWD